MSIENSKIIDFISTDSTGNVSLTISDHLEWDSKNEHLLLLQNKINAYLTSIEEGDLYQKYPGAKDAFLVINIIAKHPPNEDGKIFLENVKGFLISSGYGFVFSIHPQ
jgi:hypothetical protein